MVKIHAFKKVSITTIKVLLKKRKEKKRIIKASEALEQVSDGFLRQNAKKAEVALTFYFRDSRSIKTRKRALFALLVSSLRCGSLSLVSLNLRSALIREKAAVFLDERLCVKG